MDRVDFYYKQLVTQAELDQAFDDVETAISNLMLDQHTYGVTTGLLVTDNFPTPDFTVKISSGEAYTGDEAKRISITNTSLDLTSYVPSTPGESVYVAIVAKHTRVESDPRTDGNGNPLNYRLTDSYTLSAKSGTPSATPTKPAGAADEVYLAMVLLYEGMTHIVNDDISMDVFSIDRMAGGVMVRPGVEVVHAIHFDGGEFDADEDMIAFDGGEIGGLGKITMDGGGNIIENVEELSIWGGTGLISMNQGDINMDTLGNGSGGRIFMETGRIYKTRLVRAEGPPDSDHGFLYCEGGGAGDEFGNQLTIDKWLNYQAMAFLPPAQNGNNPWGVVGSNEWYLDSRTPNSGGVSPVALIEGWAVDCDTGASPGYSFPLILPLTGMPDGCRLDSVKVWLEVKSAPGTFNKLYGYIVRQSNNDIEFLSDSAPSSPLVGDVSTGFYSPSIDVVANDIIDNENYVYHLVLHAWEAGTSGGGDYWFISGASALCQIREASGVY